MDRPGWNGVLLTLAATVAGLVVVLAVPALREGVANAVSGDAESLRQDLRALDAWGGLLLVALMLVHAVVFFPSELLNAAAGYAYGFAVAFPLVMAGWTLSGLAAYWIGRAAGRPLLYRLAGERRFEASARFVHRGGVTMLLAARLIPIMPYSVVGYVAGATHIPVWRYTWTTAVGSAPLCAAVVYLGDRLDTLSLTDPGVWVTAGAFLMLLVGGRVLARRVQTEPE